MDAALSCWRDDKPLAGLILLVALHSCTLGLLMLFVPGLMLRLLGLPAEGPLFFPSQSGIFLLILGVCYLRALREPSFVWTILVSKAFAVAFLFVHAAFLSAPPMIGAAGVGDAAILLAVALMVRRHRGLSRRAS